MSQSTDSAGSRVAWIDASGGISGDMLLGACLDAGASLTAVRAGIESLGLSAQISLSTEEVRRAGFRATRAVVTVASDPQPRRLNEITTLIESAELPDNVAGLAVDTFRRLAEAEAAVHGVDQQEVHFHEVGALDSIADIVGTIMAFATLDIDRVVCGPISLGAGSAETAHGTLTIPGPAVLELLKGSAGVAQGGPAIRELATPTGVALALTLADEFSQMPELRISALGVGAGAQDVPGHTNVCRLVIGGPAEANELQSPTMTMIETNVDDMDPRLWPPTLTALMDVGAADAWLTPILMKKGRPAHTLHVLVEDELVPAVADLIFGHTSSIGLRTYDVRRTTLSRDTFVVRVEDYEISVKRAWSRGRLINVEPEFSDVLAASAALNLAPGRVLRRAQVLATPIGDQARDDRDSQDRHDH